MAWLPAVINAAATVGGAYLSNRGSGRESRGEKSKRKLIDELMASMDGEGKYSQLFNVDENAFQKAVVDPAMSRFENRIAPGIQQQYVAAGLQRGTGLDDSLQRAGVDLQQNINEQYLNYQQGKEKNMMQILDNITKQGTGAPAPMSSGQAFGQAGAGYLQSESGQKGVEQLLEWLQSFGGSGSSGGQQSGSVSRPGYSNNLGYIG